MSGLRWFLRSKIHRARVTKADLDYIGSVSIDSDLMSASGIAPWERVQVVDLTNGARLRPMRSNPNRGLERFRSTEQQPI